METWRDELPDDLKTDPTLAKYDTPEDAYKGLIEANGRLGRSITIPSEDAGDDDRDKFYEKLQAAAPNLTLHPDSANDEHAAEFWKMAGVPDDAKGYKPEEGFEGLPEDFVENIRGVAHAAGWTKKQFQATLGEYAKEYATQQEANEEASEADKAVIKTKWGLAEDQKKSSIQALIDKFQDPEHKLGDLNSAAYLLLDNIVAAFSGKGPQVFEQPSSGNGMTPGEIEDRLMEINERLTKEGYTMGKKQHNALLSKKMKLLEMRPT